jgi:predicted PurR-regulated permease PerM
MTPEQPVPRFFLVLMYGTVLLLAWVLSPVAAELLLAAVLAGVLWPLQKWLARKLRGRDALTSGLITTGVTLVLLGPLTALLAVMVRDADSGVQFVSDTLRGPRVAEMIRGLPEGARDFLRDAIHRSPHDLEEALGNVGAQGAQAAEAVSTAVAKTGSVLFHASMMLIALFFFLVRGEEIISWVDEASPLPVGQTRELLQAFKRVSYAVIVSTVVTSAVQAAAALVGYLIARVPSPVFFTSLTFFVAFIPAIGAASVCLVAAALLFITGHVYMAIFLAIWGLVVVGLVDNIVKPLLIRRGMEIHGGVVFFSLIGGLAAFGAIGLLVGPLVVAMFLALLRMYHRDFSPGEAKEPLVPGLPGGQRPGTPRFGVPGLPGIPPRREGGTPATGTTLPGLPPKPQGGGTGGEGGGPPAGG